MQGTACLKPLPSHGASDSRCHQGATPDSLIKRPMLRIHQLGERVCQALNVVIGNQDRLQEMFQIRDLFLKKIDLLIEILQVEAIGFREILFVSLRNRVEAEQLGKCL
jgi:hypothetical protein